MLNKYMTFNWKKKTTIYPGRFQPFHKGHKKIFLKSLKQSGQVAFFVMDSYKIDKKNPFTFSRVKKKINQDLKKYRGKFIIIKAPVIHQIVFGRKVGYKITRIKLSKKIEKISATNIRKKILSKR